MRADNITTRPEGILWSTKKKNNETNFDILKVDASGEEKLTPFNCIVNYIIKNPELECYIFADGCPDSTLKIWDKDSSVEVILS